MVCLPFPGKWVVYCFNHRFDPDLQVFAGLEMAMAFETDQHQEMFIIVLTCFNHIKYLFIIHYCSYPLAIEIVSFPIKNGDFP